MRDGHASVLRYWDLSRISGLPETKPKEKFGIGLGRTLLVSRHFDMLILWYTHSKYASRLRRFWSQDALTCVYCYISTQSYLSLTIRALLDGISEYLPYSLNTTLPPAFKVVNLISGDFGIIHSSQDNELKTRVVHNSSPLPNSTRYLRSLPY